MFNQHRAKYSLLLTHSVPGEGKGKTEFVDSRRAWSELPEERKEEFRDVIVEHMYASSILLPKVSVLGLIS